MFDRPDPTAWVPRDGLKLVLSGIAYLATAG